MSTTVGAAGYSSQQPAQYQPGMQNVTTPNRIWGTTGNTDTCIDASVHATSNVVVTATTAQAGFWHVTVSQGQFIVTSSDSESATTTAYNYRVL